MRRGTTAGAAAADPAGAAGCGLRAAGAQGRLGGVGRVDDGVLLLGRQQRLAWGGHGKHRIAGHARVGLAGQQHGGGRGGGVGRGLWRGTGGRRRIGGRGRVRERKDGDRLQDRVTRKGLAEECVVAGLRIEREHCGGTGAVEERRERGCAAADG